MQTNEIVIKQEGQVVTKEEKQKIWVEGWGNDEGPIMIVGSHPSREDLGAGGMFAGETKEYTASDELFEGLKIAGVNQDDCWFTSILKYGIGNKDKPTSKQIAECADKLDEEIAKVKPKLIITLGAEPFKRIMKTNIKQSDYMGEIIDSPYGKLMANYSPANIYRVDPKLRPEFIENFELAKRFVKDNLKYKEFKWIVITDPEKNKQILEYYMSKGMWTIGYDAEWKGKLFKDEKMYSFQYACEPDKAIILKILKDDGTEDLALLNSMKPFIDNPKADRVGWNIRADDKRLKLRGFDLPDETLGFDGMKAVAFFDSRWRKGLETGIKRFTDYPPYYNEFYRALRDAKLKKDEMSELLIKLPAVFYKYAGGDAVSHFVACTRMREEMKKRLPSHVRRFFFDTYLPLSHYLMDMELTGLSVDKPLMRTLTEQYNKGYDKLNEMLMKQTQKYGFESDAYDAAVEDFGKEETETKGLRPDFNPRAYQHRNYLFFDKMQLEPAYYVKKGKAKPKNWYDKANKITQAQYRPSSNGKSMATIRFTLADAIKKEPENKELQEKYDVVSTYLDLARVSVFANKFLSTKGVEDIIDEEAPDWEEEQSEETDNGSPLKSSYWGAISPLDGKIHADFYECLDNFRSSSRVNVQNPASKVLSHMPAIFKRLDLDAPKNIRNIFYAGNPDYHFAEVDVAGADLAIAAFLSGDSDYIRDIRRGGFHTTKMHEYFKDKTLTKDNYSHYVSAKSITFRVAYTAGLMSAALPIQAEIFAENGNLVELDTIKYALKTWERYTTYMAYREKCQQQVQKEQRISNLRGMHFNFEHTDDFGIKAGWLNQALAYPIASELALFMWDISVQMKKEFVKDGLWMKYIYPVNVVHDANYWIIHKDLMKDNYFPEICKEYFTNKVKIATGDNLGMEIVVSDRWKGKEKIFAKETKWNFTTKTWDWEK